MDFITQLREEYATLEKAGETLFKALETEKRTTFSADEKTAHDTRTARMQEIKTLLDERMKFASLALSEGKVELPKQPEGKQEFEASKGGSIIVGEPKIDRAEFSRSL